MKKPATGSDSAALNWKPRLKNAPKGKRSTSTSATTNVADQALSAMRRIDKVRSVGGDVENAAARIAGHSLPQAGAAAPDKRRAPTPAGATRRRNALFAGLAVAAAFVVAVVCLGRPTPRLTVAGKIYLERKPLGSAELRFYPTGDGAAAVTVVAAQDGQFRLDNVAAGGYRVTIHPPGNARGLPLAAAYTNADSTPLHVNLVADVDRLQLFASKVASAPGGE